MSAAPLPRRQVLAGLAGLPAAAAPATAAPLPLGGALAELWARRQRFVATVRTAREEDSAFASAVTEWAMLDVVMPATPATGKADALAALAWARTEFMEFHVGEEAPDRGDLVMLTLLDKAAEALAGLG